MSRLRADPPPLAHCPCRSTLEYQCHSCGRVFAAGACANFRLFYGARAAHRWPRRRGSTCRFRGVRDQERDTLEEQIEAEPVQLRVACCPAAVLAAHVGAIRAVLPFAVESLAAVRLDKATATSTLPRCHRPGKPRECRLPPWRSTRASVQPQDVALVGARNLDPPGTASLAAQAGIDADIAAGARRLPTAHTWRSTATCCTARRGRVSPSRAVLSEVEAVLRDVAARAPVAGLGLTGLPPRPTSRHWPALPQRSGCNPPAPGAGLRWRRCPPRIRIDVSIEQKRADPEPGPDEASIRTPAPGSASDSSRQEPARARLFRVCPQCRATTLPFAAPERIAQLVDDGHLRRDEPRSPVRRPADVLRSQAARPERLAEAEVTPPALGTRCSTGRLDRRWRALATLAVTDFSFMGGSMGSVVGEKFARACDAAALDGIEFPSSRARPRAEPACRRAFSLLMQLPKTVCALEELHAPAGADISVLTPPDDGRRCSRSFATLGDACLGRAGFAMSFAGPRVVAQTTHEKLPTTSAAPSRPSASGTSIGSAPRPELRSTLAQLLRLFGTG